MVIIQRQSQRVRITMYDILTCDFERLWEEESSVESPLFSLRKWHGFRCSAFKCSNELNLLVFMQSKKEPLKVQIV